MRVRVQGWCRSQLRMDGELSLMRQQGISGVRRHGLDKGKDPAAVVWSDESRSQQDRQACPKVIEDTLRTRA